MFHLDRTESMVNSSIIILLIGITIYLLGIRALKKIPYEDIRGRLFCAVNFSGLAIPFLFMTSLVFKRPDFLFPPNEWTKTDIVLQRYYENLESIKIAYQIFYTSAFIWVMLFLFLLKQALKNKD